MDKSPIDRFYDNALSFSEFIEYLVDDLNKRGHINIPSCVIGIAIGMLKEYNKKDLIQGFIRKSYDHWNDIKNKNDSSISDNAMVIFSAIPQNYVKSFSEIFKKKDNNDNPIISNEQRNIIWDFLHPFIKISIKYIHESQNPYIDNNGQRKYKNKYKDSLGNIDIDIIKASRDWGINLIFEKSK